VTELVTELVAVAVAEAALYLNIELIRAELAVAVRSASPFSIRGQFSGSSQLCWKTTSMALG